MSEDSYHDDPIEEPQSRSPRTLFVTSGAFIFGALLLFQGTFAGNISLSSGTGIEFGQGITQAVACSGNTDLTLTPRSSFTNGSPGSHYLNSVTVSGIPESCDGVDFTISAYNNSSSAPLAIFNTTSTAAVVYNDDGNFIAGVGGTGLSVTSGTGRFTITFTTPVALATSVAKITMQSGMHKLCYEVGNCAVGERGPGGGIVFYVSANYFTSDGSTCADKCKYLEAAPGNWAGAGYGGSDPQLNWSTDETSLTGQNVNYSSWSGYVPESYYIGELVNWRIGKGFSNTSLMAVSGATSTAKNAALSYAGTDGSAGQWFIPSFNELNELCKYARGQATGNPKVSCNTSGTIKSTLNFGEVYGGFVEGVSGNYYMSSSEDMIYSEGQGPIWAWVQAFTGTSLTNQMKNSGGTKHVRVIRAF